MATKPLDGASPLDWLSDKLRQSVTTPNALSYVPHAKQVKFHQCDTDGRLYIGGNRSGKSVGGIVEDIWWLTGTHPYLPTPAGPVRGRIVTTDLIQGLNLIILPLIRQWLPLSYLINGSWEDSYSKSERVLTLTNGSTVEFMTYEQDLEKFAGTSRHFIHFDEEPPKDIWTECKARLVDTDGKWWITMTPVEGMSWTFEDIYTPGLKPDNDLIGIIEVDMTENPHLDPKAIKKFMDGLSEEEINARIHGTYIQLGGLVYKSFNPDIHVIESFIPPLDWDWYEALDHGYNNPTAVLWAAVNPDGDVFIFDEHYQREWTVDRHAAVINAKRAEKGRKPPILIIADPATSQRSGITGDSIQIEYSKYGIFLVPANNDVLVGVAKVNQYIRPNAIGKPKLYITENCTNLIWELKKLRWKTWASRSMQGKNNPYEQIHKKDDHASDALRYLMTFMPDLTPVAELPSGIKEHSNVGGVPAMGRLDDNLIRDHNARLTNKQDSEWDLVYGSF